MKKENELAYKRTDEHEPRIIDNIVDTDMYVYDQAIAATKKDAERRKEIIKNSTIGGF